MAETKWQHIIIRSKVTLSTLIGRRASSNIERMEYKCIKYLTENRAIEEKIFKKLEDQFKRLNFRVIIPVK